MGSQSERSIAHPFNAASAFIVQTALDDPSNAKRSVQRVPALTSLSFRRDGRKAVLNQYGNEEQRLPQLLVLAEKEIADVDTPPR